MLGSHLSRLLTPFISWQRQALLPLFWSADMRHITARFCIRRISRLPRAPGSTIPPGARNTTLFTEQGQPLITHQLQALTIAA